MSIGRRWAASLLLVGLLSGCGVVTHQADTMTVERQKFINAYARARVLYQQLASRIDMLCQADKLAPDTCAKATDIDQQAKTLDSEIRAKIDTPEAEVDWERVMKLLELTLGLVL